MEPGACYAMHNAQCKKNSPFLLFFMLYVLCGNWAVWRRTTRTEHFSCFYTQSATPCYQGGDPGCLPIQHACQFGVSLPAYLGCLWLPIRGAHACQLGGSPSWDVHACRFGVPMAANSGCPCLPIQGAHQLGLNFCFKIFDNFMGIGTLLYEVLSFISALIITWKKTTMNIQVDGSFWKIINVIEETMISPASNVKNSYEKDQDKYTSSIA